jgi:hypothetical protein
MRSLQVRQTLTVLMLEFGIFYPVFVFCLLRGIRSYRCHNSLPPHPHILNTGDWHIFPSVCFLLSGIRTNAKHACPPDPHSLNAVVWYLLPWVSFCLLSGIRTNAKPASPADPHILNAGVWYLLPCACFYTHIPRPDPHILSH